MTPELWFEAGKAAEKRRWGSPEMVDHTGVADLAPDGPPALVVATAEDVSPEVARTVAALVGVGREVCIVSDAAPPDDAMVWLTGVSVEYPGKSADPGDFESPTDDAPEDVPAGTDQAQDSATKEAGLTEEEFLWPGDRADFPDPYCRFGDAADLTRMQESGAALRAWQKIVSIKGLAVYEQPRDFADPPAWLGRWSLFEAQDDGVLMVFFRPVSIRGRDYLLVDSIIGHVPVGSSALGIPGSEPQRLFANEVVAFCEIPEASAMLSRVMGGGSRGRPNPESYVDLRRSEEDVFSDVELQDMPERYLDLLPADSVLLVTRDGPVIGPLPDGMLEVHFSYLIPIASDLDPTIHVLSTCVDSLNRAHRLLWQPTSDLDGRRNPIHAADLEALLRSVGFRSYGGVVETLWNSD